MGNYLAKTKGRIHRIPVTLAARTPNHQQIHTANVLIPLEYESHLHSALCLSSWYLAIGQAIYKMYCFLFVIVSFTRHLTFLLNLSMANPCLLQVRW